MWIIYIYYDTIATDIILPGKLHYVVHGIYLNSREIFRQYTTTISHMYVYRLVLLQ